MRTPSRSFMVAAAAALTVGAGAGTAIAASPGHPAAIRAAAPEAAKLQVLKLSANSSGSLMFSTRTLKAKPGRTEIEFTNHAPESHNFTLTLKGKTIAATPTFHGGTKSITVTLKKGSYVYFCSVPGHRQAGMQGTLTVS
jgi:plastocyanin